MSETPLHTAAKRDDVARIEALLADGADIEARDGSGATALLIATHENNVAAARSLIAAGADVNAKDKIGDSPYLYAGARGHLDILRLTLAHGADLKSTNRFGGTALIPASERGHVETVRTLIAAGVDVDHVNNLGWTALLEAVILGNGGERHQQIVDLLIRPVRTSPSRTARASHRCNTHAITVTARSSNCLLRQGRNEDAPHLSDPVGIAIKAASPPGRILLRR